MKTPISPIAIGIVGALATVARCKTRDASARVVARRGDLDDVGVELLALLGDVLEVDRRGLHVVVADDPLGLAEPADLGGDVHLEVDVIDPRGDRLADQLLPLLLVAAPEAAVDAAPDREDQRRGPILEDPLQVRLAAQAVDPQLDQVDAGLGRLFPFLGQRGMPAPPDRHADHRPIRPRAGRPLDCPRPTTPDRPHRTARPTDRFYAPAWIDERGRREGQAASNEGKRQESSAEPSTGPRAIGAGERGEPVAHLA